MSRARKTIRQLAAEAGASAEDALSLLRAVGIEAVHANSAVPRGRLAVARRALGLVKQIPDVRGVTYLAVKAGMPDEEARSLLIQAGVLAKRHLKRVPAGQIRHAEEALGIRPPETVMKQQLVPPTPVAVHEDASAKPPRKRREARPKIIGKTQSLDYLTSDDIERVHWVLVDDFGESKDPIEPPGVLNRSMLESAAQRPKTALGPTHKYPTVAMAGAALLHSVVLNHAFHNGNKRTALVSILVFADRNGYRVNATEEELYNLLLTVAAHGLQDSAGNAVHGSDAEMLCIAQWLLGHLRAVQKQERSRKWNKFRQILNGYGCASNVLSGNKINIVRTIDGVLLKTQVGYRSEGTDVQINAVKKVRRDLQLDEEHGYPSDIFYRQDAKIPEFINKYRTLLRRLAKV